MVSKFITNLVIAIFTRLDMLHVYYFRERNTLTRISHQKFTVNHSSNCSFVIGPFVFWVQNNYLDVEHDFSNRFCCDLVTSVFPSLHRNFSSTYVEGHLPELRFAIKMRLGQTLVFRSNNMSTLSHLNWDNMLLNWAATFHAQDLSIW